MTASLGATTPGWGLGVKSLEQSAFTWGEGRVGVEREISLRRQ